MEPEPQIVNFRGPGIDSKESIPPDWESVPGLLKRSTNTGSGAAGRSTRVFGTGLPRLGIDSWAL